MNTLLRAIWILSGAVVGGILFVFLLILLDAYLISPGNPDAGQLGVLGVPIGTPLGALGGWLIGGRRKPWLWAVGGAPVGAFLGGGLAAAACTMLDIWVPEANRFEVAGLLVGAVLGTAGGWFLAGRDWTS